MKSQVLVLTKGFYVDSRYVLNNTPSSLLYQESRTKIVYGYVNVQISSLNLLRVVAEEEGCSMEELNAGKVCDWFVKDKLKREQNPESAVLQWDDSEFQI